MNAFDYPFDETLIATVPMQKRDQSRLMVYHRKTDTIGHERFSSLLDILHPQDLLIINDTRVFPARLQSDSGYSEQAGSAESRSIKEPATPTEPNGQGRSMAAAVELLLIRPDPGDGSANNDQDAESGNRSGGEGRVTSLCWEALVRGRFPENSPVRLQGGALAHFVQDLGAGRKKILLELPGSEDLYTYLNQWGDVPLPPYILRRRKEMQMTPGENENQPFSTDRDERQSYQTVYAQQVGSVAAPTAGLHFTAPLLEAIKKKGVGVATVTLHIGTDTFRPIRTDTLSQHKMSGESFEIPYETAYAFEKTKACGGTVYAVGTSVVRVLETVANSQGEIRSLRGETDLFITPGYRFRAVDALVTNLHPPRSTGIVLVAAFLGGDTVLRLYREAMEQRYRFFSYGDAMLIL